MASLRMRSKHRTGLRYKGVSKSNRSGNNNSKSSKGLLHPVGYSGATLGRMISHFKPGTEKGGS